MALLAEIYLDPRTTDQRGAVRRALRLEIAHDLAEVQSRAIVCNLSETGLLLQSSTALGVGEELTVHLPQAGAVPARVVWTRAPFYGCEFAQPVSRAAVSAALLRSPIDEAPVELISPPDATWRRLPESEARPVAVRSSRGSTLALVLLGAAVLTFIVAMVALRLA
jgi:hypothetical protein